MAQEDTPTGKADMGRTRLGCCMSAEELDPEVSVVLAEFQSLVRERPVPLDPNLCRGALEVLSPQSVTVA